MPKPHPVDSDSIGTEHVMFPAFSRPPFRSCARRFLQALPMAWSVRPSRQTADYNATEGGEVSTLNHNIGQHSGAMTLEQSCQLHRRPAPTTWEPAHQQIPWPLLSGRLQQAPSLRMLRLGLAQDNLSMYDRHKTYSQLAATSQTPLT